MAIWVSAHQAGLKFRELLAQALRGEKIIIMQGGGPIAELARYDSGAADELCDDAAWDHLIALLEEGLSLGGEAFSRDAADER